MFDKLSIIVPFKPDEYWRTRNWKWLKERYEKLMPEAEICIGECNQEPYNKCIAINSAVKKSTRDILLIIDADIIMDIQSISIGMYLMKTHPLVYTYNGLVRLSELATNKILDEKNYDIDESIIDSECEINKYPINSICLITKELFIKSGGYDERFAGWGHEDVAFFESAAWVNKGLYRMQGPPIYHMYHEYSEKYKNENLLSNNTFIKDNYYIPIKIEETIQYLRKKNGFISDIND